MDENVVTLLKKMAELLTAIVRARRQVNPAYPLHPAMNLNIGMKLVREINELADGLGCSVIDEEALEELLPDPLFTDTTAGVPDDTDKIPDEPTDET